jgi:formate dehydrogenase maturation protein FdhE
MGQIRDRINVAYASIRAAEEKLAVCRKECQHLTQKEGIYSWRVGSFNRALICEECDAFIKYLDEYPDSTVTFTSVSI